MPASIRREPLLLAASRRDAPVNRVNLGTGLHGITRLEELEA